MKVIYLMLLALTYSVSASSEEISAGYYYVNIDTLNVRYMPQKDGELAHKLYKREKVKVLEVKDGWARLSKYLEYNGTQFATWTYAKYLSSTPPKKETNLNDFSLECQFKRSNDSLFTRLGNPVDEFFVIYSKKTGQVNHTDERGRTSSALIRFSNNKFIYTVLDPTFPEDTNKRERYIIDLKNLKITKTNPEYLASDSDEKGACESVGKAENIVYTDKAYQGKFVKSSFKLYTKSFSDIGINDKLLMVDLTVNNKGSNDVKDFNITCRTFAESGTFLDRLYKTAYKLVKAKTKRVIEGIEVGLLGDANRADCEVVTLTVIPI